VISWIPTTKRSRRPGAIIASIAIIAAIAAIAMDSLNNSGRGRWSRQCHLVVVVVAQGSPLEISF